MNIFRPLLLSLSMITVLPALAAPPDHAPAHGYRAKHEYVYYREREIYYEPARSIWYWLDGADWRSGDRLPGHYQQYTSQGVRIALDTDRPYSEHRQVTERYGKASKTKHKHQDKHKDKGPKHRRD